MAEGVTTEKHPLVLSALPVPAKYRNAITARVGDTGPHWATFHKGTDFAVPAGTPIYCGRFGTVVHSSNDGGPEGLYVSIDCMTEHGMVRYLYFHLSRADLRVGKQVKTGQMVGLSGNTGNSTGPHLHYQIQSGSGLTRVFYIPDFSKEVE